MLDEPPSRGPLSGPAAALKYGRTTHVLALAVDLPRMTSAHLKRLWSLAGFVCSTHHGSFRPTSRRRGNGRSDRI
ncbi:MAG: NTP transferase domain-containing protein [Verrucomicrobiota bacterium]|nr:NTP transferase domain-containing protein [Verrucomicrobiota bacterium]